MSRSYRITCIALAAILAWTCQFGNAQTTTGQINGTVEDAAGAVVSGATIEAVETDTQVSRTVKSGSSGGFSIPLLPPGNYQVKISETGFSPLTESAIQLSVSQSITLNVKLQVGNVAETVQVQGSSELLNATSSSLGTVIGQEAVQDLPLNGRNFTQLLTLVPGATPVSTSQGANLGIDDGSTVAIPGSSFSNPAINGQQNRETLYLLDGVVNTDFRTTTYTVLPIVDGIREFKVQSHSDDPAFGSVLGGVVNLVTSSGTNQFHGSAWEFLRNNIFDARNSFSDVNSDGSPKAPGAFRQNEFGVSIGGPVAIPKLYNGRDETFFFFAYEGWRYTSPVTNFYDVPTAAEISGNFQNSEGNNFIFDPTTTAVNATGTGYTRQEFPNDIIPANRINTAIQTYLTNYYDAPNYSGSNGSNELLNSSYINNSNNYQGRIDQVVGKKDTIFFRWSNLFDVNTSPETHKVSAVTNFNGLNIGAGITHVFSPKLLLNVNGGRASRGFTFVYPSTVSTAQQTALGFTGLNIYGPLDINLSGPYGGAAIASPALRRNSSWSVSSNLSWLFGKHTVSFGSMVIDDYRSQSGNGQSFNFGNDVTDDPNNVSTTGNSVASALLGYPDSGGFQDNNKIKYSYPTFAVFAGDSWKVTPELTINVGLRYDHLNQPNITYGMNNGFNFDTGNWEIGGGKLPPACTTSNAAPCIPGAGTDASANLAAITGNDGSVAGNHIIVSPTPSRAPKSVGTDFGPRFGFAYALKRTTVLSGGFGIVYDTLNGVNQTLSNSIGEWPAKGSVTHNYYVLGTPLTSVSEAESTIGNPITTGGPFGDFDYYYSPNQKPMYSEQFNLKLEQTVGRRTLFSLGYVGSVNKRLDYGGTANTAVHPTVGTRAAVLADTPYPYMTTFVYDSTIGAADYHSLQAKLERRFSNGFQYLISYTWSKSLDDSSGHFGAENGIGPAIQDYYVPESNRGVSGYDIPHFVSISGLYALPVGKGYRYLNAGPLAYALGGWQLNTVAQLRSGQPYTLAVNGDIANIGSGGYGRPNRVLGGSPYVSHATYLQAYNPAAFSDPVDSFGNVGRNTMRGQSYYNDDLSLFKSFPWGERALEFRAEAFNVFNIINYGIPDVNIDDKTAGVINGIAGSPRQLQFALRIKF